MARDPYTGTLTVEPSAAPPSDYQQINANPMQFGGLAAGAEQRAGAEVQQGAGDLAQDAILRQTRFNDHVVTDATNQLYKRAEDLTYGNRNDPNAPAGLYTLKGRDALEKGPQVAQSLNDLRDQISGNLQNDAQRQAFQHETAFYLNRKRAEIENHINQQSDAYGKAGETAKIENFATMAGNDPSTDENIATSIVKAQESGTKLALLDYGSPPGPDATPEQVETYNALKQKYVRAAATSVVQKAVYGAMEIDPVNGAARGAAILQRFGGMIDPAIAENLTRMTKGKTEETGADAYVHGLIGGGAGPTGSTDDIWHNMVRTESGVQQTDASGAPLVSGKLAGDPDAPVGISQIRPSTAAEIAPAVTGQPLDRNRLLHDATYNEQLGHAYFNQQLANYGSPVLAAAAYDAGPGRVDQWIKTIGDPRTGAVSEEDFVSKIPIAETRDYVRSVGAVGFGSPQAQAGSPSAYPDESALVQKAMRDWQGNPQMQEKVVSKLTRQLSIMRLETQTARNDLEKSIPDIQSSLLDGQDTPIPEEAITRLFPPADAARAIEHLQIARDAGQVFKSIQWGSPNDIAAARADLSSGMGPISTMIRNRLAGKVAGSATETPNAAPTPDQQSPEAYNLRMSILRQFDQKTAERTANLDADPGRYVAAAPTVLAAAQGVDPKTPEDASDPSAGMKGFRTLARTSLAAQDHLGVPSSLQHVLTKAGAENTAAQLTAPGADVKTLMDGLKREWGDEAWGHVFADLVTLGKLPAAYQSVAVLDDPKDAALLARSINETSKGGKDWSDILGNAGGKPVAQTIKDAIRNDYPSVMQLERSLSSSGASAQQIDGILGSIETLAYGKKFYNQDADAAGSAVQAFTSKYRILPNGFARIPVKIADTVTSNAGIMLQGLTTDRITVPEAFRTDNSPEGARARPGAPTADDYLAAVKANPTWITSPREDALWLMDSEARIVRGTDGKPFAVPFNAPRIVPETVAPPVWAAP